MFKYWNAFISRKWLDRKGHCESGHCLDAEFTHCFSVSLIISLSKLNRNSNIIFLIYRLTIKAAI